MRQTELPDLYEGDVAKEAEDCASRLSYAKYDLDGLVAMVEWATRMLVEQAAEIRRLRDELEE